MNNQAELKFELKNNHHRAVLHLENLTMRDHLIFISFLNRLSFQDLATIHNLPKIEIESIVNAYIRGLHIHNNIAFLPLSHYVNFEYFYQNKQAYLDKAEDYIQYQLDRISQLLGQSFCENCG